MKQPGVEFIRLNLTIGTTTADQTIASLERRFESALRSFRQEMSHSDREEDSDHEVRLAVEGIARSTLVDRRGQDNQDNEE